MIPILIAWAFAMLVIGVENDIGFAMLIFTLFIAMLWITTGRVGYVLLGVALFAVGALVSVHLFSQVNVRVSVWLDPWKTASTSGFQLTQGLVRARFGRSWGAPGSASTISPGGSPSSRAT